MVPQLAALGLLAGLGAGPAAAQANDPSFRVTNNAPETINEVSVSSATTNSWGPDRPGDRPLVPAP